MIADCFDFSRSPSVYLDGQTLTIPDGVPSGPAPHLDSLWIGGVDAAEIIPRSFPIITSFKGDLKDIELNEE